MQLVITRFCTTKSSVFWTSIRTWFHSGCYPITGAVWIITKKGTAAHCFLCCIWKRRIKTISRTTWVFQYFTFGITSIGIPMIPIVTPFPYISAHIVKSILIGFECTNRTCFQVSVFPCIFIRKDSLPIISLWFLLTWCTISPGRKRRKWVCALCLGK